MDKYIENNELSDFETPLISIKPARFYQDLELEKYKHELEIKNYRTLYKFTRGKRIELKFKNELFRAITINSLNNWIDVENEYYKLLKGLVKGTGNTSIFLDITKLNQDLEELKNLLIQYLKDIVLEDKVKLSKKIKSVINSPFDLKDFKEKTIDLKVNEEFKRIKKDVSELTDLDSPFSFDELDPFYQDLYSKIGLKQPKIGLKKLLLNTPNELIEYFKLKPKSTLFLNFNYTSTPKLYFNQKKGGTTILNIHGDIDKSEENPIIFGFGDELDDTYKEIEQKNNNEYLNNVKSINYLRTDNYKRLLNFLNESFFQVIIMGHSCGLSDRTLLNTIFENNNCSSIKICYHIFEDESDNFQDISQNLSRNFVDKIRMRDVVVNKTFCDSI